MTGEVTRRNLSEKTETAGEKPVSAVLLMETLLVPSSGQAGPKMTFSSNLLFLWQEVR